MILGGHETSLDDLLKIFVDEKRLDYLLLVLKVLADLSGGLARYRTKLMKILFLLQEEHPDIVKDIYGDERPYHFTWYLFGPFSTEVFDDLDILEERGLIEMLEEEENGYTMYSFRLTKKGLERVEQLERELGSGIIDRLRNVLSRYNAMTLNEIKRYVYSKYQYSSERDVSPIA